MQKWDIVNQDVVIFDDHNKATISRILGEEIITKRYWDYLAYPIYSLNSKKVLMLGLGGGTVIQLLNKWGWLGQFDAIDNNKDLIEGLMEHGHLNYSNLNIIYSDAREFIGNCQEKYDAIVIDLYDDNGPVNDLYTDAYINKLKEMLTPNGMLLYHCIDPTSKYILFDLVSHIKKMPSFSYTVSSLLAENFQYVYNIPFTTSSLVFASNRDLEFSIRNSQEPSIQWLNIFFQNRTLTNEYLSNFVTKTTFPLTYERINKPEQSFLNILIESFTEPYSNEILKIFNNFISQDNLYGKIYRLGDYQLEDVPLELQNSFCLFIKILINQNNIQVLPSMIEELYTELSLVDIRQKNSILSYSFALINDWESAKNIILTTQEVE
ncbi:spermidine synthase [Bacillus cereus]